MDEASSSYNLGRVRQLLADAFGLQEITNLAFDLFKPLYDQLNGSKFTRDEWIRDIVDHANRQGECDHLLYYVKLNQPYQFSRHQSHFPELPEELGEAKTGGQKVRELEEAVSIKQKEVIEKEDVLGSQETEELETLRQSLTNLQTEIANLRKEQLPQQAPAKQESTFIANVPYGLETELYGRDQELALLDDWFHRDPAHPLLAIVGLGGQGKSALTWQWQKQLQADKLAPPLVVWWSFYEQDGTMRAMLAELLAHFGEDPTRFSSLRQAVDRLRHHLQHRPALILLDGAERLLRAYSSLGAAYQGDNEGGDWQAAGPERRQMRGCIDPAAGILLTWLAEPGLLQARTLLTSRLFPQELAGRSGLGLQGVRRHDLTGLNNEAAYALFRGLGIETTRAEVQAACEPLGYHPLSLRLLARAVRYSPTAPNDLRAAANYDPSSDLLGKREHVLQRAYDNLPETAQKLLSQLAAFRGSVAWRVLADVFGGGGAVQGDLQLLEERGLLQRTVRRWADGQTDTTYDLHPIVRRYAYDRLADRGATHGQLVIYFEAVPAPQRIHSLEDLAPAIELYHHLARAGRYDEARVLYRDRLADPLYFQLGAYHTCSELLLALFPDGVEKLPRLSQEADQAWTLAALANSYSLAGRPSAAVPLFEQHNALREKQGDKKNLAIGLGNLADGQGKIGELTAAAHNLRRSISLCQEIEESWQEAVGHAEFGRLLATTGNWAEAERELDTAIEQFRAEKATQYEGVTWAYRAQAALPQGEAAAALSAAQEALRLADETARTIYPFERDYVRAHWLLGWAWLTLGELPAAQSHLDDALRRCRSINMVDHEPAILLAQARLAAAQSQLPLAHTLAGEARHIAARAGYVLHLAGIHNFLAQLALDTGQQEEAGRLAQQAHDYAMCDGPPYAYQPALDEANRLLELLKS